MDSRWLDQGSPAWTLTIFSTTLRARITQVTLRMTETVDPALNEPTHPAHLSAAEVLEQASRAACTAVGLDPSSRSAGESSPQQWQVFAPAVLAALRVYREAVKADDLARQGHEGVALIDSETLAERLYLIYEYEPSGGRFRRPWKDTAGSLRSGYIRDARRILQLDADAGEPPVVVGNFQNKRQRAVGM